MKRLLLAATALVVTLACVHAPAPPPPPPPPPPAASAPAEHTSADWELGDDRVAYVNRFDREPAAVAQRMAYKITGKCGGFPKIDVETAPGFCVGLVYDGAGQFKKLRWAAPLGKTRAVVTEMGGWSTFNGQILLLDFTKPARPVIKPLITRASFTLGDPRRGIINEPNQISRGPDGRYYVGGATGIFRLNPLAKNPASTVEAVIDGLPSVGLHPLKSFTFDDKKHIYANVGSASNVCQNFTRFAETDRTKNPRNFQRRQFDECPEVENLKIGQGQIRQYTFQDDGHVAPDFKVFARGMRNSISLVWDQAHQALIEGDNGRDAINKFDEGLNSSELPHEEINVLREGGHYGWPYCYDDGRNNPEWKNISCEKYDQPQLLLPGHSAPLGFIVYSGKMFPNWYRGHLIAALHGYAPHGHRIVSFFQDEDGLPSGIPQSVVYNWEKRGNQGMGKPVGLSEMPDGSVLIVEDDPNNKVLRLFYDAKAGDGKPVQEIDDAKNSTTKLEPEEVRRARFEAKFKTGEPTPFMSFQREFIDKVCYECHQADGAPGVQLIRYDDVGNEARIHAAGKEIDIINAIAGAAGAPAMPPQGWDSPADQAEAVRLLKEWLGPASGN